MKLQDILMSAHSKANCNLIISWVGTNQLRFDELMDFFLRGGAVLQQRAGWPLSYLVEASPFLIEKHLPGLLQNLHKQNLHNSVKRNTLRIFQHIAIPRKFHGDIMNTCFQYVSSSTEKPAIKAFSLGILQQLAKQYPDILPELKTIIQDRWDNETAAFKSRARKIITYNK